MRLFATRGYDAVGIAELSQAIGVKPPSLYAAFGSKRGLFEAAINLFERRYGGTLPGLLAEEGSRRQVLERLLVGAASAYAADPELRGCMVIEGARGCSDKQAEALVGARREATRALIAERFRGLGDEDPELTADYAVTILGGLSAASRDGMERGRLAAIARLAARAAV